MENENGKVKFVPPPIEESYDTSEPYKTPQERYFTELYALNIRYPNDDYRVYIHSNRICVVTLAPSHEILKNEKKVLNVDYQVTDKRNTFESKASGKRKRGAVKVIPTTPLLIVNCGEKSYKPCAAISGKLLEVNPNLAEEPNLLAEDPGRKGFLAILLPEPSLIEVYKKELVSKEDYYKNYLKA